MISQRDQCGVVGQVVKNGPAMLEKKWQVIFCAPGHPAGAQFGERRTQIGIAVKTLEPCHLKAMNRVTPDGKFPRGHEFDLVDPIDRSLSLRIKGAECFHLVVQQIDAIWHFAPHGEDVQ